MPGSKSHILSTKRIKGNALSGYNCGLEYPPEATYEIAESRFVVSIQKPESAMGIP